MLKKFKSISSFQKKYDRDGYYIFKDILSNRAKKELTSLLVQSYSKISDSKVRKDMLMNFVYDYEKNKKFDELYAAYKIMSNSKIFKNIEKELITFSHYLFNKKYKHLTRGFALGVKNSKRTSYDWHQEQAYYQGLDETVHYQFSMLNKCNKSNGTMSVLSGSHKEGFIRKIKDKTLHKKSVQILIPNNIRKLQMKYKEIFINLNPEDICIFHPNIVHKSNPTISTKNKTRFVGIVRLTQ
tara:strand:- start:2242 stop:2961 length:720 start_codon:yes stop_codon:yes gene_type:complete